MNLIETLSKKLEQYSQHFFLDSEQKITFKELNQFSDSLSWYISKITELNDLIIIACHNSANDVIAYLSSLKSERITLLLPSLKLLNIYTSYINVFNKALIITSGIEDIKILSETDIRYKVLNINSSEFRNNLSNKSGVPVFKKKGNDPIVLLATGGTTGIPKLVELTNSNLLSNLLQIEEIVAETSIGNSLITVLPFFHAYGLLAGVHFPIFFGADVYLKKEFLVKDFLDTIISHRIEICFLVPQIVKIFNKFINHNKLSPPLPLKLCVSGGDRLEPDEFENFKINTGIKIIEGYGLTECSPVTHLNPLSSPQRGSIGKPLPQTICKIVNGQLLLAGPQVMKRYFNNEEETNNIFSDGFLKTGDIVEVNEDGFYFIKGRIKDVIKCAGESIFPNEIERTILKLEDVEETAVIGKNDPRHGQVPVAFVVKKSNSEMTEKKLLDFLRNRLPKNHIPKQIIFLDSLPKTPLGKIKKYILKDYIKN
ncbi:MAG: AMP-binding protein [Planctomycetota bacterium]